MHGRLYASLVMVTAMMDQSVDFACGMAAQWEVFAINFALSGDLTHALDRVAASKQDQPSDQTALENLFWD